MAKSSSGLLTVLLVSGAVLTGTAASAKVHVRQAAYHPHKALYMCSTCKVTTDKSNKCPMCKVGFNKDGSCPKCGGHLVRKRV